MHILRTSSRQAQNLLFTPVQDTQSLSDKAMLRRDNQSEQLLETGIVDPSSRCMFNVSRMVVDLCASKPHDIAMMASGLHRQVPKAYCGLPRHRLQHSQHCLHRLTNLTPIHFATLKFDLHIADQSRRVDSYSYNPEVSLTTIQSVRIRRRPQLARQQTSQTILSYFYFDDRLSGCIGAEAEQQCQTRTARRGSCGKGEHRLNNMLNDSLLTQDSPPSSFASSTTTSNPTKNPPSARPS
jgi:hypothetical protein